MRSSSRLHMFVLLLLVVICLGSLTLFGSTHAANVLLTRSLRVNLSSTKWSIVSSPSPGTADNFLNGVAAMAATDIWTVGHYTNSGSGYIVTLIEHWNGTNWSIVPSQNPEPESILNSVAAVSSNDVWAVGYQQITNTALTLIEHWDGTSWSVVPSPNGTSQQNILTSIAANSANDIWAVGYDNTGDPFVNQTLIEHWDGIQWSVMPSPNPAAVNNVLTAVTAITTSNIWAVGYQDNTGSCLTALIEHWNGKSWRVVTNPNQCSSQLMGITALTSKNIWAVGRDTTGQPLIDHWNGTSWSIIPSPSPGTSGGMLTAVEALSVSNIWAVGWLLTPIGYTQTLSEHWNGTSWNVKVIPNATSVDNVLNGLAKVSGTSQVWAVGNYYSSNSGSGGYFQTLTECHC